MSYRYAVPQDNFGQIEKLASQENEIALQKAMQPGIGQRLIGAVTGIGHSLLDYDRGRKKREFDERKDLAMRAMSRNDYEFDINQVQNWITTGQGLDGSRDIPVSKKPPIDKQSKVDDWVTEDLSDPANPKYFLNRATADAKGNMKTDQLTIDKPAYEQMKKKQAAGPRDFYGTTPQERSVEKDMADLKGAKYSAEPNKEGVLTWVYNKEWPNIYKEAKLRYAGRPDLLARIETYNRSGVSVMQAQQLIPGWHKDEKGNLVRD